MTYEFESFLENNAVGFDINGILRQQNINQNYNFAFTKLFACASFASLVLLPVIYLNNMMKCSIGLEVNLFKKDKFSPSLGVSDYGVCGVVKNIIANSKEKTPLECAIDAVARIAGSILSLLLGIYVTPYIITGIQVVCLTGLAISALCETYKCLTNKNQQQSQAFGY
jgi:hypothetical protein